MTYVLASPAAAKGGLLRNVLDLKGVHHLAFVLADRVVAPRGALGVCGSRRRTIGQVAGVAEAGEDGGGRHQAQPVLYYTKDMKSCKSVERLLNSL